MSGLITTDHIDFRRGAAPANPSAGIDRVYWKNDGIPYTRDSAGVERAFLLSTVPEANKALLDNLAEAWAVVQGADRYMVFKTTDGAEEVILGADPSAVTTAKLNLRAGLGGWAATSTGGMTLDSAGALEINSSAGAMSFGNDAVNQGMSYGTAGTRTLTFGSATATFAQTGASFTWNIKDNVASPWTVTEGANRYLEIITTDANEEVKYGNSTTNPKHTFLGTGVAAFGGNLNVTGAIAPGSYAQVAGAFSYNVPGSTFNVTSLSELHTVADNTAAAWKLQEGANAYITVDTTNGSEKITLNTGNVSVLKNLDVDGTITTKLGMSANAAMGVYGALYVNDVASGEVVNTNLETVFNKAPAQLVANSFSPLRKIKVRAAGIAVDTNGGNQQLTIRVRALLGAGPTTINLATLQFNANDSDTWAIELSGHVLNQGNATTRNIASLVRVSSGQGMMTTLTQSSVSPNIDTTQPITIQVSAQWQNQHVDNRARLDFLEVELG